MNIDGASRQRVLHAISEFGPVTATSLAAHLGVTPTAIRRHLDHLGDDGLIVTHETTPSSRGRGRPARSYVISDAGHDILRSAYDDLAADAVRFLADAVGTDAVADFAKARFARLEARYAEDLAHLPAGSQARVDSLVALLNRDGFAASARPVSTQARPGHTPSLIGVQVCQGHCPVQHVAEEFPAFCDAETAAFGRLLGVHVQRLATLAQGDHVCTTFVPLSTATPPAPAPERSLR